MFSPEEATVISEAELLDLVVAQRSITVPETSARRITTH